MATRHERQYNPTRSGLSRLRDELKRLLLARVPAAAPLGTSEERAQTASLGARIARLDRRIADALAAEDTPAAPAATPDVVDDGAAVLLLDDQGNAVQVSIVAEEEANPAQGKLAHLSDAAQALLGRHVGDVVFLRLPTFTPRGRSADASGELCYAYRRYTVAAFDYATPPTRP